MSTMSVASNSELVWTGTGSLDVFFNLIATRPPVPSFSLTIDSSQAKGDAALLAPWPAHSRLKT